MKQKKTTIAVIGLGYVGLPLAILADKKGYRVIGIDIDRSKVKLLNQRISPFGDKKLSRKLYKSAIKATTDFSKVKTASIIIICVPTPIYENQMPNLKPLENACKSIAPFIKKGQLIIIESTVNPGVSENFILPILEKKSNLKGGKDFFLAHCPERINPGDENWRVDNIPRVIGSLENKGLDLAFKFYKSIISGKIKPMSNLQEAEAVKIVENAFRDVNIAFVNELAMSFSRLGIDVTNVISGAATKPFSFMSHFPGCGVGGHCIPVDPYYLIEHAKKSDFNHDFLLLARKINNQMPKFTVEKVIEGLNEKGLAINGTKIAVLGLAYKPNVDDCRESPSIKIVKYLKEYGAEVVTFDPFAVRESSVKSLKEVIENAKAIVIATNHDIFIKEITPDLLIKNEVNVVIDGRNCLDKEKFLKAGIIYKGIGR